MKKKILLVLTFILSFLIFTDKAFAARLDFKSYTLECIYEDGGLYTEEWSAGSERIIDSRTTYNLVGSSKSDSNKGGSSVFVDKLGRTLTTNQGNKETTYCASKLHSADLTSDNNVSMSFYKFDGRLECKEDSCSDFELERSGWCWFWGCAGATGPGIKAAENQKNYKLVSERYLLSDDYPEPNKTLYYVMPAEQKIGTAAYVRIYIYDNIVLLVKDGRATRIDDSEKSIIVENAPNTLYLNSPEPIPVSDSSSVINYKFNKDQVKYSISTSPDATHKLKFTKTDNIPDSDETSGSLCTERLKNTSPVLKSIIQWGQILLPALVIILTAFDIGKIVISGNVEEELPKRKKTIINRAIILVVFLFLPLLVKVLLKLVKTSGSDIAKNIEYIDCLFDSSATAGTGTGSITKPGKTNNSKTGITAEEK